MTDKELKERISHIDRVAELQKRTVYREYVEQNAKYKIGDIVRDNSDTIRVERIGYSFVSGRISIFYYGPVLTKKGEQRKDGRKSTVYESAIKLYGYERSH